MTDHNVTIDDGIGTADAFFGDSFDAPDSESIFDPEEVKGPDPEEWGDDADRPGTYDESGERPVPVDDAGEPMEVKGPDPAVWGSA